MEISAQSKPQKTLGIQVHKVNLRKPLDRTQVLQPLRKDGEMNIRKRQHGTIFPFLIFLCYTIPKHTEQDAQNVTNFVCLNIMACENPLFYEVNANSYPELPPFLCFPFPFSTFSLLLSCCYLFFATFCLLFYVTFPTAFFDHYLFS